MKTVKVYEVLKRRMKIGSLIKIIFVSDYESQDNEFLVSGQKRIVCGTLTKTSLHIS